MKPVTIARGDFGVVRLAAALLAKMAEKARKSTDAIGAQSDAGEVLADAQTLTRRVQESDAAERDLMIAERLLVTRLATALRLHALEIDATMEWEQANLFQATELQARLNQVNALVALCDGRDSKAA